MKKTLIAAAILSSTPLLSMATSYTAFVNDQSVVNFNYEQMGVSLEGTFKEFDGSLSFDTDNPEAATVRIVIPLASVDTGSSEGDEEVAGKAWFNINEFPTASFESTQINALGDNNFDVTGTLTIKGNAKEVSFPATFSEEAGQGHFKGEFTLQRGDFAIGEGTWSKYDIVANDVKVNFALTAQSH